MLKSMQVVLIIIIGLITFEQRASAIQITPRPQEPLILSTEVDRKNVLMIISGRNFGNHPPSVWLADHALEVKRFSPTHPVSGLLPISSQFVLLAQLVYLEPLTQWYPASLRKVRNRS